MVHRYSPDALARRRERAAALGFLRPQLCERGFRLLRAPIGQIPRIKAFAASVALHDHHDALNGYHSHYARNATCSATEITDNEKELALRVHRLPNKAKHGGAIQPIFMGDPLADHKTYVTEHLEVQGAAILQKKVQHSAIAQQGAAGVRCPAAELHGTAKELHKLAVELLKVAKTVCEQLQGFSTTFEQLKVQCAAASSELVASNFDSLPDARFGQHNDALSIDIASVTTPVPDPNASCIDIPVVTNNDALCIAIPSDTISLQEPDASNIDIPFDTVQNRDTLSIDIPHDTEQSRVESLQDSAGALCIVADPLCDANSAEALSTARTILPTSPDLGPETLVDAVTVAIVQPPAYFIGHGKGRITEVVLKMPVEEYLIRRPVSYRGLCDAEPEHVASSSDIPSDPAQTEHDALSIDIPSDTVQNCDAVSMEATPPSLESIMLAINNMNSANTSSMIALHGAMQARLATTVEFLGVGGPSAAPHSRHSFVPRDDRAWMLSRDLVVEHR